LEPWIAKDLQQICISPNHIIAKTLSAFPLLIGVVLLQHSKFFHFRGRTLFSSFKPVTDSSNSKPSTAHINPLDIW
jgi:hypothetical protein